MIGIQKPTRKIRKLVLPSVLFQAVSQELYAIMLYIQEILRHIVNLPNFLMYPVQTLQPVLDVLLDLHGPKSISQTFESARVRIPQGPRNLTPTNQDVTAALQQQQLRGKRGFGVTYMSRRGIEFWDKLVKFSEILTNTPSLDL